MKATADRVIAVGSVNHAHIELSTPIDVPVEMPIGVRYGDYDTDIVESPLADHLKIRKLESGVETRCCRASREPVEHPARCVPCRVSRRGRSGDVRRGVVRPDDAFRLVSSQRTGRGDPRVSGRLRRPWHRTRGRTRTGATFAHGEPLVGRVSQVSLTNGVVAEKAKPSLGKYEANSSTPIAGHR